MAISYKDFQKVRKALGLTQRQMGAVLGMSGVNLHFIETGQSPLRNEHIDRLKEELGIDVTKAKELVRQYDHVQKVVSNKVRRQI